MNNSANHTDEISDPWKYGGRLFGALLLVIGFYWLGRYSGQSHTIAKVACVAAGILWSRVPRSGGRRYAKRARRAVSYVILQLGALLLVAVGLFIGAGSLELFTTSLIIHYTVGAAALMAGAMIMVGRVRRLQEV